MKTGWLASAAFCGVMAMAGMSGHPLGWGVAAGVLAAGWAGWMVWRHR